MAEHVCVRFVLSTQKQNRIFQSKHEYLHANDSAKTEACAYVYFESGDRCRRRRRRHSRAQQKKKTRIIYQKIHNKLKIYLKSFVFVRADVSDSTLRLAATCALRGQNIFFSRVLDAFFLLLLLSRSPFGAGFQCKHTLRPLQRATAENSLVSLLPSAFFFVSDWTDLFVCHGCHRHIFCVREHWAVGAHRSECV